MIDTNQRRRANRERTRIGRRALSPADWTMRNAWLALYRDGDKATRDRAARALRAMDAPVPMDGNR